MNNNELSIFSTDNIDNLPMASRWQIQKQGGEAIKNVMLTKIHEDGRAYLANSVLEHAGTLSALEQHLSQLTPDPVSQARYKHIVDSYVLGASNKLVRW